MAIALVYFKEGNWYQKMKNNEYTAMRKIILFIILLTFCFEIFSQNKSQRRIYLWDVTLSMKGFEGKTPDIYDDVVDFLKREINSITDESTEIIVLPFQESILEHWVVKATESGKEDIIKKITKYNNKNVTNTNIVVPMKTAQEKYINKDKKNLLFLLTDGKQTGGNHDLLNIIRNWDEYAAINDAYAVYVMLTEAAKDSEIIGAIGEAKDIDVVIEPGITDFIVLQPEEMIRFNIKDDQDKPVNIPLISKKDIALPENIKVKITSADNPYLKINETVIIKDNSISFKLNYDYQTLKDSLPENEKINIHLELQNREEIKKKTGKIILISPNDLKLELINKPEKILKIHVKKS